MRHKEITVDLCRELLTYNPEDGKLYWKPRNNPQFNGLFAGREAFTFESLGYKVGRIKGKAVSAHRVGFGIYHGYFPDGDIDHINGNRKDNRVCNLRAVTHNENQKNTKMPSNNTSGRVGVSWSNQRKKWCAYINNGNKRIPLGRFDLIDDAISARENAEKEYKYHDNHGRLDVLSS